MDTQESTIVPGRFVVPAVVATHFHLRAGDVVADFGAGKGFFLDVLSTLVGSEGHVYACEIQRGLAESMTQMIRSQSLDNAEALWSDIEEIGGTKIPDGALDAGIVVNTLFQMEDKQTALQEMFRTLRKGGKLFIIDWSESFGGLGPQPGDVISEQVARELVEGASFVYERSFPAGDHHYGLAFRKP